MRNLTLWWHAGYATLLAKVGEYDLKGAPFSWTAVVAMRHALTKYPDCQYVWFLDAGGFIMNPKLKVEDHVMQPARLDELMKKDHPVVPPDSIIKTFSHLRGQDVDLVLTQDTGGLSAGSLVVRNGEWARFFLETWFDPLYRSYNFQKAETHALVSLVTYPSIQSLIQRLWARKRKLTTLGLQEHIVQWHPTILARMAIVDQRVLNAYSKGIKEVEYKEGDLTVRIPECPVAGEAACEAESKPFVQAWRRAFDSS